jgi:hypothetical protein
VNRVLTIDPKLWTVTIRREGDEIIAYYGRPVRCTGPEATVHSVDTVHLLDDEVRLNLRGGPFAPGLTDEGDGSSEIEFEVEHGIGGALELRFGTAPDSVAAASPGPEQDALNLNAGEAVADADLVLQPQEPGFGRARVTVSLGSGADKFDSRIGSLREARNGLLVLGEAGRDRLTTGAGNDTAVGGPGRDWISTGAGADFVDVNDGVADRADCGRAIDLADGERADRLRACQRFGSATDAQLEAFFNQSTTDAPAAGGGGGRGS